MPLSLLPVRKLQVLGAVCHMYFIYLCVQYVFYYATIPNTQRMLKEY